MLDARAGAGGPMHTATTVSTAATVVAATRLSLVFEMRIISPRFGSYGMDEISSAKRRSYHSPDPEKRMRPTHNAPPLDESGVSLVRCRECIRFRGALVGCSLQRAGFCSEATR